jgi:hypothetical protein
MAFSRKTPTLCERDTRQLWWTILIHPLARDVKDTLLTRKRQLTALHIKSNLCFVYWVLLCFVFVFVFFKDIHYNTMIRTFCINEKITFSAFHYLTLSIRCEELDTHIKLTVFISEKRILWIHFGENVIDIWGGADFDPYSSQSFAKKKQKKNIASTFLVKSYN